MSAVYLRFRGGEEILGTSPRDGGVYKKQGSTSTAVPSFFHIQSNHFGASDVYQSAQEIPVLNLSIPRSFISWIACSTSSYSPVRNHSRIPISGWELR